MNSVSITNNNTISTNIATDGTNALISKDYVDLKIGGDTENTIVLYICEEWQTKKPIKLENGLILSEKNDLYSNAELQEMIYDVIQDQYPEKAIKLGLNSNEIAVIKWSPGLEINTK